MYYTFVHPCDSSLVENISSTVGEHNYFLICMGSFNYLFVKDDNSEIKLRGLLAKDFVRLHPTTNLDAMYVIGSSDMKKFQTFHGNKELYDNWMSSYLNI